ncbi:MAG TPA: hypothetical protein VGI79_15105 [Caulobacteraceae bacterium]|jgi:hypothetical protein
MMIRLGFVLAFALSGVAYAGVRDDAAAVGDQSATAISNYMTAWADVKPVDCSAGAEMGERLAGDMVGAVEQLSSVLGNPQLDTPHQFVLTERLDGVAPYAAQGQLSLADGYNKAQCYAKAREAYQVVLDTFAGAGFEVYRQHAQTALRRLPPG